MTETAAGAAEFAETAPPDSTLDASAEHTAIDAPQVPDTQAPDTQVSGERERGGRRRGGRGRNRREPGEGEAQAPGAEDGLAGHADSAAQDATGDVSTPPFATVTPQADAAAFEAAPDVQPAVQAAADVSIEAPAPAVALTSQAAVSPAPTPAPAPAPAPAPRTLEEPAAMAQVAQAPGKPFELPLDSLQALAASAGLEWVNSDAGRIEGARQAMAEEPKPARVPRAPKPQVVVEEGALVLVETRKDLSQLKLPFDHSGAAGTQAPPN
ncbi:MAG: hypothetical protein ABIR94_03685 [Rubrivivax sp.]